MLMQDHIAVEDLLEGFACKCLELGWRGIVDHKMVVEAIVLGKDWMGSFSKENDVIVNISYFS